MHFILTESNFICWCGQGTNIWFALKIRVQVSFFLSRIPMSIYRILSTPAHKSASFLIISINHRGTIIEWSATIKITSRFLLKFTKRITLHQTYDTEHQDSLNVDLIVKMHLCIMIYYIKIKDSLTCCIKIKMLGDSWWFSWGLSLLSLVCLFCWSYRGNPGGIIWFESVGVSQHYNVKIKY